MKIEDINGHSVLADWLWPNSIVLDLGANVGVFSREAHERFRVRTVAVEPNLELHPNLRVDHISKLIGEPVTSRGQDVVFSVTENSECSGIFHTEQSPTTKTVSMKSISLASLLERCNLPFVDWLKMDIEGAEIEILLQSPPEVLLRVRQMSVEFHESNGLYEKCEIDKVIKRLEVLGFRWIKGSFWNYSDVLFFQVDGSFGWTAKLGLVAQNRFREACRAGLRVLRRSGLAKCF